MIGVSDARPPPTLVNPNDERLAPTTPRHGGGCPHDVQWGGPPPNSRSSMRGRRRDGWSWLTQKLKANLPEAQRGPSDPRHANRESASPTWTCHLQVQDITQPHRGLDLGHHTHAGGAVIHHISEFAGNPHAPCTGSPAASAARPEEFDGMKKPHAGGRLPPCLVELSEVPSGLVGAN